MFNSLLIVLFILKKILNIKTTDYFEIWLICVHYNKIVYVALVLAFYMHTHNLEAWYNVCDQKLPEYEYELIDALKTDHTYKRCYSPRCQNLNCGLPFYTLS